MNKVFLKIILACFFCNMIPVSAQSLSKEEAIRYTLENNYGITISNNQVLAAENNQKLLNSGYLPQLTGNAGANYQKSSTTVTFPSVFVDQIDLNTGDSIQVVQPDRVIEGVETQRYNADITLSYLLFDGLGRFYNYKLLKEQYNLSALQARETIENTLIQMFSIYYELARLLENKEILEETLAISQERVKRATYQFEYGQNTKLGVLNAEVDVANDSIALLNINQSIANTKRDLGFIMNREVSTETVVDTTVFFVPELVLNTYTQDYTSNNVSILQSETNISINNYDLKVSKSGYLPTIGLNGSYGWNQSRNPPSPFFPPNINNSNNLSAGVNLTWNLFDGGTTITRVKNARIALENQEIALKQIQDDVARNLANALGTYQNLLKIYDIQQQNVITNMNNFERSEERFKLGQITSIEFRQAQINLLNARTNKNLAKYDAKLAELQLLQLTGQLLNVDF
ncbi:TolC family protein [Aquimarina sp. ERC-38]|uniref:TolC family protein n=1 Tax=Aquimarina sp. ERC-38 TaxID=2949996 RepID=UPI002245C9D4|nr:TolC family protein [Aquimarina sp. ERC-38]UZO81406.1 TolC family protein [Aquimarina sp. ERC-38]